ncbi:hypothetical protein ACRS6Y_09385 [Bacillus cytotoxicus]|nr:MULTISPECIES: hypothetical protein [Bacillus cereus group]MDH2861494.1 hypothetical protein [Bacillus cytotoxicus]MDH2870025.1 hypothetical protein [Bacillus cytotoxicus]MDH2874194.1 hypothetical protein [Bacillus cytotoxicus]MDH2878277.1 hypothetical protein [Bacillus cytotoxicus]MDH2882103.1 hypothetical protein [Bacillus cytotoxicus]
MAKIALKQGLIANSVNVELIDRIRFISLLSKEIGWGITGEIIDDDI